MTRSLRHVALSVSAAWFAVMACGGNQTPTTCTKGQSIACVGSGGCSGYQVCNSDGTYDSCDCGGVDAANDVSTDVTSDTGIDVVADAPDAATFTPKSLPGLALWLDDTVGVIHDLQNNGLVKRWQDQSGNKNDAVGDCSSGGACQTGALPAIDPAALNGLDVFTCNLPNSGASFKVADATTLQFGSGDWAVAEVYKPPVTDVTNGLGMWMKPGSNYMSIVQTNVSTLTLTDDGLQISVSPTAGKWGYFVARGHSMSLVSNVGTATGASTTGDISSPGSAVVICNDGSTGAPAQAEIAEVVAIKGALSDADQTKLIAYFKAKFAL